MHRIFLVPVSQAVQLDTWHAAGLAGSASNSLRIDDVFVPSSRTLPVSQMTDGVFPQSRYSAIRTSPALGHARQLQRRSNDAGYARGAMDVFMEVLPTRGPITFTGWTKTAETLCCIISSPERSSISKPPNCFRTSCCDNGRPPWTGR